MYLLTRKNSIIENETDKLDRHFRFMIISNRKTFLGMNLKPHPDGSVLITQSQLIEKVLTDTGMDKSNPVGNTADQSDLTNRLHA